MISLCKYFFGKQKNNPLRARCRLLLQTKQKIWYKFDDLTSLLLLINIIYTSAYMLVSVTINLSSLAVLCLYLLWYNIYNTIVYDDNGLWVCLLLFSPEPLDIILSLFTFAITVDFGGRTPFAVSVCKDVCLRTIYIIYTYTYTVCINVIL